MKNTLEQRKQRHIQLSSQIAQIDDERLQSLLDGSESKAGWGKNHTLEIGNCKVFIKRIPVTDLEFEHQLSSKNLYGLPPYYQYGIGSAGFGVFRELLAHIKTTDWVLSGRIENFPLLYHHRIVPVFGERPSMDLEHHENYVKYWGGDKNIARYMLNRAHANHELVLFLEYIPFVLHTWLQENFAKVRLVLDSVRSTINFLRQNGIIHFDAHFNNLLTDGERVYMTDFGLVLDKHFALSDIEQAFFAEHTHYDYGEVLSCLRTLISARYDGLTANDQARLSKTYPITPDQDMMSVLLSNIEKVQADGILQLNENYVECLVRYRPIIDLMYEFYSQLRRSSKKDTNFPNDQLHELLLETGFAQ